jgi:hypothetical protein
MSKADILNELSKLGPNDRQQVLDKLWELEERDLLQGIGPTPEEQRLLDRELDDYQCNPDAGAEWEGVQKKLLERQ